MIPIATQKSILFNHSISLKHSVRVVLVDLRLIALSIYRWLLQFKEAAGRRLRLRTEVRKKLDVVMIETYKILNRLYCNKKSIGCNRIQHQYTLIRSQ